MNANQLALIRETLASGQPVDPHVVAALCDEVERLREIDDAAAEVILATFTGSLEVVQDKIQSLHKLRKANP